MASYCGVLSHELIWRNETVGQAGQSEVYGYGKSVVLVLLRQVFSVESTGM